MKAVFRVVNAAFRIVNVSFEIVNVSFRTVNVSFGTVNDTLENKKKINVSCVLSTKSFFYSNFVSKN